MSRIYVYKLIDPTTSLPFYVGKGKGNRMYHHEKYHSAKHHTTHNNKIVKNKIAKLHRNGQRVRYQRYWCSTEEQAFNIEKLLIERYGRRDNGSGILCNMTRGGEGVSGHQRSQEWRMAAKRRQHTNSRGYDQYTMDGTYIKTYETVNDIRNDITIKLDTSALSLCVNNQIKSMDQYRWTWKGVNLLDWPERKSRAGCVVAASKTVFQRDTTTNAVINSFPSITIAANSINKHPNTLKGALDVVGKRGPATAGGFIWTTY